MECESLSRKVILELHSRLQEAEDAINQRMPLHMDSITSRLQAVEAHTSVLHQRFDVPQAQDIPKDMASIITRVDNLERREASVQPPQSATGGTNNTRRLEAHFELASRLANVENRVATVEATSSTESKRLTEFC